MLAEYDAVRDEDVSLVLSIIDRETVELADWRSRSDSDIDFGGEPLARTRHAYWVQSEPVKIGRQTEVVVGFDLGLGPASYSPLNEDDVTGPVQLNIADPD